MRGTGVRQVGGRSLMSRAFAYISVISGKRRGGRMYRKKKREERGVKERNCSVYIFAVSKK